MSSVAVASLSTVVVAKTMLARSVCRFELADPKGRSLPEYSSGAHIAVETPRGLVRTYSLNEPGSGAPFRYAIAVARGPEDGGAASLIDELSLGQRLIISPPRNNFPLVDGRSHLLIAGGIGITPIRSMFKQLRTQQGVRVRVLYLSRDADSTPYLAELGGPAQAGRVTIHHSASSGRLDLWPYLAKPDDTHVYCCGPENLMDEVRALTAHWDPRRVHFEHFTGATAGRAGDSEFTVQWRPTGESVVVGAGETVLDALRGRGIIVNSSCNAGTCGSCSLRLLSGTPDHRDVVLTDAQRQELVTPCVSRALSPSLELAPIS